MTVSPPLPPDVRQLLQETIDSGVLDRQLRGQHGQWRQVLDFGEFRDRVLERVWERRLDFQGNTPQEFLAWVRRIGWSMAVDALREKQRQHKLVTGLASMLPKFHSLPEDRLETRDFVQWLLAGLSARERKVLILKYFHGQTNDQIGQALQTTREGAAQLHYRAIAKLRLAAKKPKEGR
ncbi:MAG: sigma-70 family RNA polymerase sigma factor [Gemmataceae bacterium]|nr:sigma-70 family RNA polymerase sigma factor [Gemmataceae bacterium]